MRCQIRCDTSISSKEEAAQRPETWIYILYTVYQDIFIIYTGQARWINSIYYRYEEKYLFFVLG